MPVPAAPCVPTVVIVTVSSLGGASILIVCPTAKPVTLATLMFVAPAAAAAASVVGPAGTAPTVAHAVVEPHAIALRLPVVPLVAVAQVWPAFVVFRIVPALPAA